MAKKYHVGDVVRKYSAETGVPFEDVFGPEPMKLEEYAEKFKDVAQFKREDGILEVRLHTNGDSMQWGLAHNRFLQNIFRIVNDDYENEVMILTGAGEKWIGGNVPASREFVETMGQNPYNYSKISYDMGYAQDYRVMKNMINDLQIPLVCAINGWSLYHTEFMLLGDVTICAPDAEFRDAHFAAGTVPGDGQLLVLQELLGTKRANYMMYMNKAMSAQEALEAGIVNEVVPREKIYDRAWEIARTIAKQPVYVTRLTHDLVKRPYADMLRHLEEQFKAEMWSYPLCLKEPGEEGGNWFDNVHKHSGQKGDFESNLKEDQEENPNGEK